MMETQMAYIIAALDVLEAEGAAAMAPTQAAQDAFNVRLQADLKKTVWGDPACGDSWYKTEAGDITQNWSGSIRAYEAAVAQVKREDYNFID